MGEEFFAVVMSFASSGMNGQILLFFVLFCSDVISSLVLVEWAAGIVRTTSEGRGHWRTIGKAQLFFL